METREVVSKWAEDRNYIIFAFLSSVLLNTLTNRYLEIVELMFDTGRSLKKVITHKTSKHWGNLLKGNLGAGSLASFLLHLIVKYFYDWLIDWGTDWLGCKF